MENKIKFIIFGLIGILAASLFFIVFQYNAKEVLQKEKDQLEQESAVLNSKVGRLENSLRDNEGKISALNKQLDEVTHQKEEFERKYELAKKNQNELMEKLKSLQQPREAIRPQLEVLTQDTDTYWAGVLKVKTDLELQLDNIRNELKSAQVGNEQLKRERSDLSLGINNLKRDNEDLKRQLEYNQKLMDSIAQELVREKNDKLQIQDSSKLIKNENAVLTRQLNSLNNRKVELEKALNQLQGEKAGLQHKLTNMETTLSDKISKVNEIKEQLVAIRGSSAKRAEAGKESAVELPPIIVRPSTLDAGVSSIEAPILTGKISAVNKENNFVIIDLGEEEGIKMGDIFKVYKGNKAIGEIEVIQLRKAIAACDIKKESAPIMVGDTVK